MPNGIQIRRDRPWQTNPRAIKVDRTTRWGNPFRIGHWYRITHDGTQAAVEEYGGLYVPAIYTYIWTAQDAVDWFERWIAVRPTAGGDAGSTAQP
jgi:uncharacterized protein DUF4326